MVQERSIQRVGRLSGLRGLYRYRYFYLLLSVAFIHTLVFRYGPMYGVVIAFKNYRIFDGILGSPWVGLENFTRLFDGTTSFYQVFRNTLLISVYRLVFGFPAPIVLALLLNELRSAKFKRVVQTISYLPHFLSWIILAGLLKEILSPSFGVVNRLITMAGGRPIYFLADKGWFVPVLISSGIWQSIGWGSIIYLATITGIDPQLYEAATIDGAGKMRQVMHITLPCLAPVVVILFILQIGNILDAGFDQIFNLYNPVVYAVADIIDTYVYRVGLVEFNFSLSAATGLFKNVIGLILVIAVNRIARVFGEYGIW